MTERNDPHEKACKTDRPFASRCLAGADDRLWCCTAQCGAEGQEGILKAINDYRAELKLEQLEEVAELSAAEKVWTDAFRAAGNVELPFDEKLYDAYDAKIEAAEAWVAHDDHFGLGGTNTIDCLDVEVPANEAELKALVRNATGFNGNPFVCKDCRAIGIEVVTIGEKMYFVCTVYDHV